MALAEVALTLARVSPKLKTPIQLTGVIVAGILFYLGTTSSPPNLLVQISSGLIAISVLVFGVTLNLLASIPEQSRANFILKLYAIFGGFISLFLIVCVYFLLFSGNIERRARASELADNLRKYHEGLQAELDKQMHDRSSLQELLKKAELDPPAVTGQIASRLDDLNGRMAEGRQKLAQTEEILADLAKPAPMLIGAIEAARNVTLSLASASQSALSVSTAYADDFDRLKVALSKKVQQQAVADTQDSIYLSWLRKVSGEITADEAIAEAETIWRRHPDSVDAIEYLSVSYEDMGKFEESRQYFDILVKRLEPDKTADPMKVAFALMELATATRLAKGGESGREYIVRAEDTYAIARSQDEVILANIENDFGGFYLARNDLESAKKKYEKALEYFERPNASHFGYAFALLNLGKIYVRWSMASRAMEYLDRSIDVQKRSTGLGTPTHCVVLQLQGDALLKAGQYAEAKRRFEMELYIVDKRKFRLDLMDYVKNNIAIAAYLEVPNEENARGLRNRLSETTKREGTSSGNSINLAAEIARIFRVFGNVGEAKITLAGLEIGTAQLTEIEAARFEIEQLTTKIWVEKTSDESMRKRLSVLAENAKQQYGREGGELRIRAKLAQAAGLAIQGNQKKEANDLLCDLRKDAANNYAELNQLKAEIDRAVAAFELEASC
jgi:tetratricopeptide (TPR) repeat protein